MRSIKLLIIFFAGGFSAIAGAEPAKFVLGGAQHACALTDTGNLYCWNWDVNRAPIDVRKFIDVRDVASGRGHTCAIIAGEVKCWGDNSHGQSSPRPYMGGLELSAGDDFTCVRMPNDIACWGRKHEGPYIGSFNQESLSGATKIVSSSQHTCAQKASRLLCWHLSSLETRHMNTATEIPVTILAGRGMWMAGVSGGALVWWNPYARPIYQETIRDGITAAAASDDVICIVQHGSLKCRKVTENSFNQVAYSKNVRSLAMSSTQTCVIDDSGPACWTNKDLARIIVPIDLTREVIGFVGLRDLASYLRSVGKRSYRYKNDFFVAVAKSLGTFPMSSNSPREKFVQALPHVFALNVVESTVSSLDSEALRSSVEAFHKTKEEIDNQFEVRSLNDIEKTNRVCKIAIEISAHALIYSREFVGDERLQKDLESLVAELSAFGASIEGDDNLTSSAVLDRTSAAFNTYQALIDSLESERRTSPFGKILAQTALYFER